MINTRFFYLLGFFICTTWRKKTDCLVSAPIKGNKKCFSDSLLYYYLLDYCILNVALEVSRFVGNYNSFILFHQNTLERH